MCLLLTVRISVWFNG